MQQQERVKADEPLVLPFKTQREIEEDNELAKRMQQNKIGNFSDFGRSPDFDEIFAENS